MSAGKPTTRLRTGLGLLLSGCLACGLLVAEEEAAPDKSFGEVLDVDLVTVDVLALDAQGDPVLDLTPADFEVLDDGRPMTIQTFRGPEGTVEFAEPTRKAKQLVRQQERRGKEAAAARFVLFFDQQNTGVSGARRILAILSQALTWLPPQDEVMVITFDGGIQLEMPFSTDRERLLATVERVASARVSLKADLDRLKTWREIESVVSYYEARPTRAGAGAAASALPDEFMTVCDSLAQVVEPALRREEGRIQATAEALEWFARSLSGFEGRKVILHVSDGIGALPAGPEYLYAIEMCDGTAQAQGSPIAQDGISTRSSAGTIGGTVWDVRTARTTLENANTSPSWQRAGSVASSYDVTIYPVQASGLDGSGPRISSALRASPAVVSLERLNRQDPLVILAEETGGTAILNTNDFRSGLEGMLTSTRSTYVLGYAAPEAGDGERHRIKIKVNRDGLTLRHRKSYRSFDRDERVVGRLISSLLYGNEANPLAIDVEPRYVSDERTTVRTIIPLEHLTLLEQEDGSRHGLVTVFVVSQDAQGQSSGVRQQSLPVRLAAGEAVSAPMVYDVEMKVPLAEHDFAVAVRDEFGGALSFVKPVAGGSKVATAGR